MGLDKKSLDRIVQFVKTVKDIPGNEEFIADLRKVLEIQTPTNVSTVTIPNTDAIEKIEHYLGLDYSLDRAIPRIDYSFVTEDDIRNQLEADYREMLRYRYGLRAHKVDFMEFCRYVQLQAEMVLNYYYNSNFKDDNDILAHLSEVLPWLGKIKYKSYQVMLSGFCKDHNIDYNLMDGVREIRNTQSHRSTTVIDINNMIAKAEIFAKEHAVWFNMDTKTFSISTKQDIKELFKKEIGIEMKSYNLHAIAHTQPYNDIINSLSKIVSCISRLM